jgi:hypothetical protein
MGIRAARGSESKPYLVFPFEVLGVDRSCFGTVTFVPSFFVYVYLGITTNFFPRLVSAMAFSPLSFSSRPELSTPEPGTSAILIPPTRETPRQYQKAKKKPPFQTAA